MRESPRFFGPRVGLSAQEVYAKWIELGLIEKYQSNHNTYGWHITELGESLGGRLSPQGTPTFDYKDIKHLF